MSAIVAASPRRRMSKDQRREQLLDVAAAAVTDSGPGTLTMERLAELAGVSKALPYTHFESIDHVLISLYRRESHRLGVHIWETLEAAEPDDDLVALHITAYFDGVARSGGVFGALSVPGSTVPGRSDPRNEGPRFSARVLRRFHGVDRDRATVLGPIVNAAILGAGNAWRRRVAGRAELEQLAVHMLRSAVAWEGVPQ